jgi:hypothetical protein
MSGANIAFAQSPPGIGRKRPSLPGQPPGDRASAVPLQLPQMRPVGREYRPEWFESRLETEMVFNALLREPKFADSLREHGCDEGLT